MRSRALLLSALLAIASSAPAEQSHGAGASPGATGAVRLAIQIPRLLQMRILEQPHQMEVTAEDLARGFVRAHGLLEVLSTHREGYFLRAHLLHGPVVEARVDGLERPVQAGAGGETIAMPSMVGKPRPAPYPVEYQLSLAPGTQPGTYAWPLSLSVEAP